MNYPDFVELVKQMREEQKKYFATRNQGALFAAKDLEKKVDKAISEPIEFSSKVEFQYPKDYETKRG